MGGVVFFIRLLDNSWSDLDDFFGTPPWNFNFDEMVKKSALYHVCERVTRIADFGQFWSCKMGFINSRYQWGQTRVVVIGTDMSRHMCLPKKAYILADLGVTSKGAFSLFLPELSQLLWKRALGKVHCSRKSKGRTVPYLHFVVLHLWKPEAEGLTIFYRYIGDFKVDRCEIFCVQLILFISLALYQKGGQ